MYLSRVNRHLTQNLCLGCSRPVAVPSPRKNLPSLLPFFFRGGGEGLVTRRLFGLFSYLNGVDKGEVGRYSCHRTKLEESYKASSCYSTKKYHLEWCKNREYINRSSMGTGSRRVLLDDTWQISLFMCVCQMKYLQTRPLKWHRVPNIAVSFTVYSLKPNMEAMDLTHKVILYLQDFNYDSRLGRTPLDPVLGMDDLQSQANYTPSSLTTFTFAPPLPLQSMLTPTKLITLNTMKRLGNQEGIGGGEVK